MSAIFQEAPPKVKIHPLPRRAKYVTFSFDDTLCLTAWMPNGLYDVTGDSMESKETFEEEHCRGCERNCESFLDEYRDEESGEIDWDEVGPHCDVYNEGYYGQDCPLGYTRDLTHHQFNVAEIAFEIRLSYRPSTSRNRQTRERSSRERYSKFADSAYMCASKVIDSKLYRAERYLPANVFGYNDSPGVICWGRIEAPKTLRGIESNFFATPFNNDLTRIDQFEGNSSRVDNMAGNDDSYYQDRQSKVIINNEDAENPLDTLVIVDAEQNVHAFFSLLCAGFQPEEQAPHMMLIPARETELNREGMTFRGYLTKPDDLGKEWFISEDALLVGQI